MSYRFLSGINCIHYLMTTCLHSRCTSVGRPPCISYQSEKWTMDNREGWLNIASRISTLTFLVVKNVQLSTCADWLLHTFLHGLSRFSNSPLQFHDTDGEHLLRLVPHVNSILDVLQDVCGVQHEQIRRALLWLHVAQRHRRCIDHVCRHRTSLQRIHKAL